MNDELGNRMKLNYENVSKTYLTRRMPVIIRLDGKAFHTFTKSFKKPFDLVLGKTMEQTMKYLCKNIQGCVLGYCQSDEISLLLVDYQKLNTDAWFNYAVQKCTSVSASMTTLAFNKFFTENANYFFEVNEKNEENEKLFSAYKRAMEKGAMFDSRIFNIPKEEVINYFIWRQNDCYRNSVNTVAQSLFPASQLYAKNTFDVLQMIGNKYKFTGWQMFGTSCTKEDELGWDTCIISFKHPMDKKKVEGKFLFEDKNN